jgi:hypothetical protein
MACERSEQPRFLGAAEKERQYVNCRRKAPETKRTGAQALKSVGYGSPISALQSQSITMLHAAYPVFKIPFMIEAGREEFSKERCRRSGNLSSCNLKLNYEVEPCLSTPAVNWSTESRILREINREWYSLGVIEIVQCG